VSERERTDTDLDLDFDFFDSPTSEAPPREVAPPRRAPRLPRRPPGPPGTAVLRLGALILGAIVIAAVLVLWVNRCREDQRRAEYRDYMGQVSEIAGASQQVGRELNTRITTPGIRLDDLQGQLNGLAEEQEQLTRRAEELEPPGPLREQQEELVEALRLRVSGLSGLTRAFDEIAETRDPQAAGRLLAVPAERLVASDVVYEDLFQAPARAALGREDVGGVDVPASNFVQNADLASASSWALVVERLTRSPTAGGLRGNMIAGVRVQPEGTRLSPTEENTVTASDQLAFEVLVENSGTSQETQVRVNLNIQQTPQPIRKQATIDLINPGQTRSVVFRDLAPSFGILTTVQVNVEPVPGESNTGNNTAEYSVIFTLP
jgi:hypothetical protein